MQRIIHWWNRLKRRRREQLTEVKRLRLELDTARYERDYVYRLLAEKQKDKQRGN
jgi:hypothetical protein